MTGPPARHSQSLPPISPLSCMHSLRGNALTCVKGGQSPRPAGWSRLSGHRPFSIHDIFFALGGENQTWPSPAPTRRSPSPPAWVNASLRVTRLGNHKRCEVALEVARSSSSCHQCMGGGDDWTSGEPHPAPVDIHVHMWDVVFCLVAVEPRLEASVKRQCMWTSTAGSSTGKPQWSPSKNCYHGLNRLAVPADSDRRRRIGRRIEGRRLIIVDGNIDRQVRQR